MNKIQYQLFLVPQSDLEVALNKEGQAGWEAMQPINTPAGMCFLMKRKLDEQVTDEDLDAANKAVKEAELMARFGAGVVPPGNRPLLVK